MLTIEEILKTDRTITNYEKRLLLDILALSNVQHNTAYSLIALKFRELWQGMVVRQYGLCRIEAEPSNKTLEKMKFYEQMFIEYRKRIYNSTHVN